jgi:hypothetical protein
MKRWNSIVKFISPFLEKSNPKLWIQIVAAPPIWKATIGRYKPQVKLSRLDYGDWFAIDFIADKMKDEDEFRDLFESLASRSNLGW